jgi:hypothetical protein
MLEGYHGIPNRAIVPNPAKPQANQAPELKRGVHPLAF